MVLDALRNGSISQNLTSYILRDIIYYCFHCIENANIHDLQQLALKALEQFLEKLQCFKEIEYFIEKHLHFICKSFVRFYKTCQDLVIQEKVVEICVKLTSHFKHCICDKDDLRDIFPADAKFLNLQSILDSLPNVSKSSGNWQTHFKTFLENKNLTVDSFKTLQNQVSRYIDTAPLC